MDTGVAMGTQPGQSMYKKMCTGCHTIGVGDKVGPDLRGVTERRDRAWLVSYLRDPIGMMKRDPVARALAEKYPTVRMPNMRPVRSGCRRPDRLPAERERQDRGHAGAAGAAEPTSTSTSGTPQRLE